MIYLFIIIDIMIALFLFMSSYIKNDLVRQYLSNTESAVGHSSPPNKWPPRWLDDREHSMGDSGRLSVSGTSREAWDSGCEEIRPSAEK